MGTTNRGDILKGFGSGAVSISNTHSNVPDVVVTVPTEELTSSKKIILKLLVQTLQCNKPTSTKQSLPVDQRRTSPGSSGVPPTFNPPHRLCFYKGPNKSGMFCASMLDSLILGAMHNHGFYPTLVSLRNVALFENGTICRSSTWCGRNT